MFRLGLDIGGTKIEAAVLDDHGDVAWRQRFATRKNSYTAFFSAVVEVIRLAQAEFSVPLSIGIGIPGTVDAGSARVKNANIQILNGQTFAQDLAQQFQQAVAMSNDANCFTLSEAIDGSGKGADVVFGVILGTGCGGGLSIGGRVIGGANGCSGEWGHTPLPHYRPERDGPAVSCYCSQQNCVESFISGTGFERQYLAHLGEKLQVTDIIEKVNSGDVAAAAIWHRYLDQVARSLANIVNMVDPDVIVLGGGVSNVDILYPELQSRVAHYVFGKQCCTPFRRAMHGDSSGVRGAAWLGGRPHQKRDLNLQ
ncbi:ROK family protein [Enterobacteriaceae bacterium H4N4]|uniref:ROK family protein n=1 Tax=Silvania confinis TaxID=2926470 RepID=A0A9J6QNX4_9ENTR|nr:ROK family protein [Silvania confinis]MCU6670990.1 ROK family protein [Silvania confinis]